MATARRALIIANGMLPPRKELLRLSRQAAYIVCADGGANHARRLGVRPDVILGDLDSVGASTLAWFRNVAVEHIEDQETTDLEKAISHCLTRGYAVIDVAGATGDRVDHTTGALGCMRRYAGRARLTLYDAVGTIQAAGRGTTLRTRKAEQISLIPLNRCSGVTTTHLKYPLRRVTLQLGVREGISNEATSGRVHISVRSGTLLIQRFW